MAICLTVGRSDGSAMMVIGVSNVIPQHPPFIQEEEVLPACKKLLHEIYDGPERTSNAQIWMYY